MGVVKVESIIERLIPADYMSDRPVFMRRCIKPLEVGFERGKIWIDADTLEYWKEDFDDEVRRGRVNRNREMLVPTERADIHEILIDLCRYVGFFEKGECLTADYIDNVAFSEDNIGEWIVCHGMPSWQPSYSVELFRAKAHVLLATIAAWQALKEGSFSRLKLACDGVGAASERWLHLDNDAQQNIKAISDMIASVTMAAHGDMFMLDTAFDKTIRVALFFHSRLLRGIYTNTTYGYEQGAKAKFALQLVADDIFSRSAYELAFIMINDRTILTPCARDGCKEMFIKQSGKQVFCSNNCRLKAFRKRKGEDKRAKKA
jgi:hypothetical protein